MPTGIAGIVWDFTIEGLRISRSQGADLTFVRNQIPSSTLNAGMQATQDWLNANLPNRIFGPSAPPPYMRVRMKTMTNPFYFEFLLSDSPLTILPPGW